MDHPHRPCQHCRWRDGKEEEGDQEGPQGEIDGQQSRTMELLQMSFSGVIPITQKFQTF